MAGLPSPDHEKKWLLDTKEIGMGSGTQTSEGRLNPDLKLIPEEFTNFRRSISFLV